jgi:glycosyltransferase involved in cell wall biosynthesis
MEELNKGKNVLCILPSKDFYGKERANIEVYNLLDNNGFSLRIVANKNADRRMIVEINKFRNYKLPFPGRWRTKFKYILYFYELFISNICMIWILLKENPDVIFINSESTFYDFFLPLYFTKIKIIYRIGDAPAFPKLSNFKYNSWVWNKIVCRKVHSVICVSYFILEKIRINGRVNDNDGVIYSFPPSKIINGLAVGIDESNSLKIGYVGQIFKDKGVGLLLKSAISLIEKGNNVSFYFAGSLDYKPEFTNELLAELENSGFKKKIKFLGEIDDTESFYDKMDLLVVPSIKEEPLANVLVESKYKKLPAIIFNSGGLPELVEHKRNGFICSDKSTVSIEKAIKYYIENPQKVEEHGVNAFNSIEELKIGYPFYKKNWLSIFK